MNKTKRTLIISSCIMALAFVVAVVGVSAAWFGDMKSASQGGFVIESDTLQDVASIDINSVKGMSGEQVFPAVSKKGYFQGINPPIGEVLRSEALPDGIEKAAEVATIYFPIQFLGTPDSDYADENRKSLELQLLSATVDGDDSAFDYADEFNVDTCLIDAALDSEGKFESDNGALPTTDGYEPVSGGDVYYVSYGRSLYMLVQPGLTYWVRVEIYFNKIDEECNPDLIGTVIKFNFKLNVLTDGGYIRNAEYATDGGGAND